MPSFYRLKVHAEAKAERLERRGPDSFEAWVKAPPREGRANAAVLALLAAALELPVKRLRIVKGASSPSKLVTVLGS